jgi:hypothetical protein
MTTALSSVYYTNVLCACQHQQHYPLTLPVRVGLFLQIQKVSALA